MHFEGIIIRPPSEAYSILLQVTVGCSHNRCTFCGTYKTKRFKIKNENIIMSDIISAARSCRHQNRLFLCDGDALIIPQPRLLNILLAIEKHLPWVSRVGIYGNAKSLKKKSAAELSELKTHGLGIIYMGLESGDDETLNKVNKKGNAALMIDQGRKVKAAGIKLSLTVLLGLAGPSRSQVHAQETGRILSAIDPDYVGALSLMLLPDTPLYQDWQAGNFDLMNSTEMLRELRTMMNRTNLSHGLFHANHASNYLPIRAQFPQEKAAALDLIDQALAGNIPLKPESLRAL
ncbi:radical SAM protein [candidate division CSSED10-310 bacterium]|uniref:Radical SAM protein n=1 Tax=candidate division CSSED10-310 bacterium TaxID=2855610 RepID=A0ABV6YXS9_UNCC1